MFFFLQNFTKLKKTTEIIVDSSQTLTLYKSRSYLLTYL